ncbi:class I SAM-dependent methyltransferase [Leeuwenhoekiella polynyae]|uniref:Trans-aconitate methyltransferase n=1 Tax=Leeuwenhoekiella polynyae TaxID=1550906 RepID=A0A4Q0PHN8_9FLAO|nr:class I SAM-dependent methyltransferase [Leeuwenhoekiella polynyae]RXG26519.1 trans-aconitate methyltransferase [Leeuwenhoekiella polynyae]
MWEADLYREKHGFVFDYGKDLISMLNPKNGERILDLGCGTGELTAEIAESGADLVGIDASVEMIKAAQDKFSKIKFIEARGESFIDSEQYDAIFSNATLHWILNPEAAISAMYSNLKPDGRLLLEMGGNGNIETIISALSAVLKEKGYLKQSRTINWYFPKLGTYCHFLEQRGFQVTFAHLYERPTKLKDPETGIIDWLKMFAGKYFTDIPENDAAEIRKITQQRVHESLYKDGFYYADYKRLRICALK